MLVNERIRPGTYLEIYKKEEKGDRVCTVKKRVEVIQQYPHHVLVKTEKRDPDVYNPCGTEAERDCNEEILRSGL